MSFPQLDRHDTLLSNESLVMIAASGEYKLGTKAPTLIHYDPHLATVENLIRYTSIAILRLYFLLSNTLKSVPKRRLCYNIVVQSPTP